ncbi:hypothetical protein J4E91_008410 [Alternaria rosae]|nr:hypothetical protein J4E91_008410 [Alternaria rosae]
MPESRRQSTTPTISTYHLYNRTGSSCARRVRIALSLKKVPNVLYHDVEKYTRTSIGTKQYLAINPSGAVPTLIHEITTPGHSTKQRFVLTQSIAILEYLDEMFPGRGEGEDEGAGCGGDAGYVSFCKSGEWGENV